MRNRLQIIVIVSVVLLVGWLGLVIVLATSGGDGADPIVQAPPPGGQQAVPTARPAATSVPSASNGSTPSVAPRGNVTVQASVETEPVPTSDDAADDIAIWQHPSDPSLSLVIGTDKDAGWLFAYNMDGSLHQSLKTGDVNNVDIRLDFPLGNERVPLLIASDRSARTIAVFKLDPQTRQLSVVPATNNRLSYEPYGICLYRSSATNTYYAFVTEEEGERIEQWEIRPEGNGVSLNRVRTLRVSDQAEGCVADDVAGVFYVGEEDEGIWRYAAEPGGGNQRVLIDSTGDSGNLEADVEGLTIYYDGLNDGYLIASSQGNDSYVIYSRVSNAYIGTFRITNGAVDGVQESDGIDVSNLNLGPRFPNGAFIAQDGENTGGRQNFKLVPWESIANAFNPPLRVNTTKAP